MCFETCRAQGRQQFGHAAMEEVYEESLHSFARPVLCASLTNSPERERDLQNALMHTEIESYAINIAYRDVSYVL